ncbi:uncharacterized protein LOC134835643 [Culicoides brevitarsis]|uniref:uncharacterized protein LOC134835643 n=1 Tax=Culicoides brevitarsis TaxID=469753 RepID=UPI00307B2AB9
MEVMEEGILMDRLPILLQRDMQYYEKNKEVLQETICPGVVGGKLDFPRYASFASVKIVLWLEDEYYQAYLKKSGLLCYDTLNDETIHRDDESSVCIVKSSDPERFVWLVARTCDALLQHIHVLSQEALDHADLTVLTAVIGAAALVKNCLWVYLQCTEKNVCPPKGDEEGGSLKMSYKQLSEMTEALAERLLDLHCRLLLLYILQDADCLHWENQQPFFESERGSYTIQMWWLYMQGTKMDLWNTVPPTMGQRVFAGMLNETLTVLTVRYTQTLPSKARAQLLMVDICNILLCCGELLPAICDNGEAYVGLNITNQHKIVRDIHSKCQELFLCLLLRGIPIGDLYKVLRKGTQSVGMFQERMGLPSPWILFALSKLFPDKRTGHYATRCSEFTSSTAITLELRVLMTAPQPSWPILIKVLLMREATLSSVIFHHLIENLPSQENFVPSYLQPCLNKETMDAKCEGFLCGKECNDIGHWALNNPDPVGQTNYQVIMGLTYIIVMTGKASDIQRTLISALEKAPNVEWAACLDRRDVWNQKRQPWLEAIIYLVYPILDSIVQMLIQAVQTGATIYQAMSLSISCFQEMWDGIPDCLFIVTSMLQEIIPADIRPLGDSCLVHVLYSALYTKLLENATGVNEEKFANKASICQTLAEAICAIDEDNKHTEKIQELLNQAKETLRNMSVIEVDLDEPEPITGQSMASGSKAVDELLEPIMRPAPTSSRAEEEFDVEIADYISEILASDILTQDIGKQSVKMIYMYMRNNVDWIYEKLGVKSHEPNVEPPNGQELHYIPPKLLHMMFHIGEEPFDQLLTGNLKIDYTNWFQTPMSMTPDRAWLQVKMRWEFQENAQLNALDSQMVAYITSQLKTSTT